MRVLLIVLASLSLGCSSEVTKPPPPPPPPPPITPHVAILKLIAAYEQKKTVEYEALFTGDFTYEFSNSTDPVLVAKYSTGWFKSDESSASAHLFQGYTPQGQPFAPAASSINIDFENTQPVDDGVLGRDPVTHKFLATRVDGLILIPPTPPATDPTNYLIENNFNGFYLVRGDQAVGLTASQPADSVHWYIYRWVDLTVASPAPATIASSPQPALPATWGKVKGLYR